MEYSYNDIIIIATHLSQALKDVQPHWSNFPSLPAYSLICQSPAPRKDPVSETREMCEQKRSLTSAPGVERRTWRGQMAPCHPERPSALQSSPGGAFSAGADTRFCCGPAKGQALRVSCPAAGRGLGVDLVDWKFTHLPPD